MVPECFELAEEGFAPGFEVGDAGGCVIAAIEVGRGLVGGMLCELEKHEIINRAS